MNEERLLKIILAPHLTEKASQSADGYQQLVFKVRRDSSKPELKIAIEQLFSVKVRSVRVTNMKSKPARFGQIQGHHKAWKKAYVTLEKGSSIEMTEQQA